MKYAVEEEAVPGRNNLTLVEAAKQFIKHSIHFYHKSV
jgi:hypothetical protein